MAIFDAARQVMTDFRTIEKDNVCLLCPPGCYSGKTNGYQRKQICPETVFTLLFCGLAYHMATSDYLVII